MKIARRILDEEVTQIEVYTECVKRIVGRVLHGNGTTELLQGMRIDAFRAQRGEEVYCFSSRRLRLRSAIPPPQTDQRLGEGPDDQRTFGSGRAVTRIAATPHNADENQPRTKRRCHHGGHRQLAN